MSRDVHGAGRLVRAGAGADARLGVVAVHGRGGSAADVLGLVERLAVPDLAAIAPEAADNSWWPVSFLSPQALLAPWVGSALGAVERAVAALGAEGIGRERVVLLGFSQGACLVSEYAARTGGPLHSVWVLSGALVGTGDAPGEGDPALYGFGPKLFEGYRDMPGVPVYLGCHERDPHIPAARVEASGRVFGELGAEVRVELFPGAGHGVVAEEVAAMRGLLNRAT